MMLRQTHSAPGWGAPSSTSSSSSSKLVAPATGTSGTACPHRLQRRGCSRVHSSIDDFPSVGAAGQLPHTSMQQQPQRQRQRQPSRSPSPMPSAWSQSSHHAPNAWGEPSPWDVPPQVWWGSGSHGETGMMLDSSNYRSASPSPSQCQSTLDSWDFNDLPVVMPPTVTSLQPHDDSSSGGGGGGSAQQLHQQHQPLFVPRPVWTLTDRPGIDLCSAGLKAVSHLHRVYVILFGVGQKDTEGIYSLRAFSEEGLPQETIIVFESEEDAVRYAGLLEATMEHTPSVCSIPPPELLDFCREAGYQCRMEPSGSLLIPPDFNVSVTDWERSLRLREGHYAVLEAEPEGHSHHHPQLGSFRVTTAFPQDLTTNKARYQPFMSEAELQHLRAKLEALLPADSSDDGFEDNERIVA